MQRLALVLSVVCLVLAVVIFILADGVRRWYSGGFFALISVVMVINYLKFRIKDSHTQE